MGPTGVTKPYKFIRFGAMDVTKPCKFIYRVWRHQRLKDASHDGWFGPGRAGGTLKSAIRMLATALKGGQQQFKNANHGSRLEPGRWPAAAKRHESRRMAWAGRADEMLTFAISILITAHYSGQQ